MKRKLLMFLACSLIGIGSVVAQDKKITGKVVDGNGDPIIGATVLVTESANVGTITDVDGQFELSVPSSAKTLTVSFIGMEKKVVEIADKLTVTLLPAAEELDEVMVVAFGTTTKKSFTGSASVVKSDELSKRQSSNVTNSLAGQVAGVQGLSSNGAPGSGSSIRIRGIGSMYASNAPLYVVDGIPYDGDISTISNSDIESITVLKDAASNALYGARGANGVIMITTKRGKTKDAQITVDAKWGSNSREIPTYNVMTDPGMYYETFYKALYNSQYLNFKGSYAANEYANKNLLDANNGGLGYQVYTVPAGQRLIGINGRLNPNATLGYSNGTYTYTPDNWFNELFNYNNFRQEYNVNVSGSTENLTYYASATYLEDTGIIENSDFRRFTSRASVDYQAKKWLKIGTNMSYANYSQRYPGEQTSANSSGNLFFLSTYMAPIYPLYIRDAAGNIMKDANGYTMYDYGDGKVNGAIRPFMSQSNPASAIALDQSKYNVDLFSGKWYATVEFYKGLKATANIGLNMVNNRYAYTQNPYYGQFAAMGGAAGVATERFLSLNQQYLLTYANKFAGAHNVDLLVGYEAYRYKIQSLSGYKQKLYTPDIAEVNNAILQPSTSSATGSYATMGILAQAKYDYDSRYFVSASYRHDASSVFAPEHRWGDFWSVGLAWDINNENFLDVEEINLLKLKVSYGAQGNDNLGNPRILYAYTDQYTVAENNGNFATTLAYKGNRDLTWETSYNFNAGIDFSFFDDRLSGTIEGFRRRTKDMLYYKPVPSSLGYSSLPVNVGSLSNAGMDVELHGEVIKTKEVSWKIYANLTYFQNRILKLDEELGGEWVSGSYKYKEGGSLYNLYIRKYAGVDPMTGAALYYKDVTDANGEVIGQTTTDVWADATQYETGDILPKVYGGFGTSLDVYGVDLSIAFAYQLGGRIIDNTYADLMHSGDASNAGRNWHIDILDAWTPENTNTNVPRLNSNDQYTTYMSDRWLVSSNYLSLQNVTLGYSLPSKWVKKMKMEKFRIYAVADNVALVSARKGLDPRQGYASSEAAYYAPIRSISGGLSITF